MTFNIVFKLKNGTIIGEKSYDFDSSKIEALRACDFLLIEKKKYKVINSMYDVESGNIEFIIQEYIDGLDFGH